ncbi:MAG TPA: peptidoglycan recognition family protein [Candidatus Saccharimonadales bacterium]|nr:peptidoglycan recognition family protein [Candidatus Saccharimonadales bacterium]
MTGFDEEHWTEAVKSPGWCLEFNALAREMADKFSADTETLNKFKRESRGFFEKALLEGKVALAASGPDLDKERQPIDTIVIHHTSAKPGYRLSYMNATQLLNVYAPEYKNGDIWSNHLQSGKQVFYVYHWLMRMDGSFERLLDDPQIGWHAGSWEVNKCSIAICLDNDYENQDPSDEVIDKLAKHIKSVYPDIKKIIGHCEANSGTICPGTNFLSIWKSKLLRQAGLDSLA